MRTVGAGHSKEGGNKTKASIGGEEASLKKSSRFLDTLVWRKGGKIKSKGLVSSLDLCFAVYQQPWDKKGDGYAWSMRPTR